MTTRFKKTTIAFFLDWFENSYQISLLSGVKEAAREYGVNLIAFIGGSIHSPRKHESGRNVIYDFVDSNHFDGIIVASGAVGAFISSNELAVYLESYKPLPIVSIAQILEGVHSIMIDNTIGFDHLITHLIEVHNCRKIAYIGASPLNQDSIIRYNVYKTVLTRHNLPINPAAIIQLDFTSGTGIRGIRTLLDERKIPFDAVVAANDEIAYGVIEELKRRQILIPYTVAVTGFDDQKESKFLSPMLTTVRQPCYQQAKKALETLLDVLSGKKVPLVQYLPAELVIRESCGCLMEAGFAGSILLHEADTGSQDNLPDTFVNNSITEAGRSDMTQAEIITFLEKGLNAAFKDNEHFTRLNIPEFCSTVLAAVETKNFSLFIGYLNRLLVSFTGAGVVFFQSLLSAFRFHLYPCITQKDVLYIFESLWQQAQCHVFNFYMNYQAYLNMAMEKMYQHFRDLSEELVTLTELEPIVALLADNLPIFGFKSAFFSLYDETGEVDLSTSTCRLILAYNEKGRIDTGKGGIRFFSRDLIPASILEKEEPFSYLVEPVFFGTRQLGLVLFDPDLSRGFTFDILRRMFFNSALKGAIFIQQVRTQTDVLEAANEKLTNTLNTLKQTQDRLVQSEKMAALGNLVAGVAHEINTPIGISVTASSHLGKETENLVLLHKTNNLKKSNLVKYLDTAAEATQLILANLKRAFELIYSFKNIAVDQSSEEKRLFKFKAYINEILLSLKPQLKNRNLTIDVLCDDELEIFSDPGSFSQIITNLMINALMHAYRPEDKGIIKIRASAVEAAAGETAADGVAKSTDKKLILEFSDDGRGIKKEYMDKIYDPFFTTNRSRGGTGLGLYVLYNIITSKLEGTIHCSSNPGTGTTFTITIPLKDATGN